MSESYSARLKTALCEKTAHAFGFAGKDAEGADDCCKLSFFAALLLFGCKYSKGRLVFRIQNEALVDLFASAAVAFYSLPIKIENGKATLTVTEALLRVLRAADLTLTEDGICGMPISVCGNCQGFFLRAVFLCTGTMADPAKSHQLNLFCDKHTNALSVFLHEADLPFGTSVRRGHDYLYLRRAGGIEDFLARIGAESFVLELINGEIERSMRANINRQNNFDTANISRSSAFLLRLGDAVECLEERGSIESLPDTLQVIVRLLKQYPEETLSELGARIHPPLSKSGLYHRAKKIIALAEHKEV